MVTIMGVILPGMTTVAQYPVPDDADSETVKVRRAFVALAQGSHGADTGGRQLRTGEGMCAKMPNHSEQTGPK